MTDLIEKQIAAFVDRKRPPEEIRDEVDLGYSYQNYTVEIFEIRPRWDDKSTIQHIPVAKSRYIKSQNVWRIYWMRSNLKWTPYAPQPEVKRINDFLNIVDQDALGCFFG